MSSLTANDPRMERVRHTLKDVQRLSAELATVPQETKMHAQTEPLPLRSADAMAGQLVVTTQPEVSRRSGRRGAIIGGVGAVAAVAAAAVVFAVHPSVLKPYLPEGVTATFTSLSGAGETAATQATRDAVAPTSTQTASTQTAATDRQAGTTAESAKLESLPAVRVPNAVGSPAGQAAATVVASASAMLASGDVLAARQELLRARPHENPDVAWTLARSYDPRHLARINSGKNLADVEAAAKWYRVWQKAGQKDGMISPKIDIERLIRGMTPN